MAYKSPYNQARMDYLRSARRCTSCGARDERTEAGRYLCIGCQAKNAAYNRRRRERLIAAGMCYLCGQVPARPGLRTCAVCAKKQTAACMAWRRREYGKGEDDG